MKKIISKNHQLIFVTLTLAANLVFQYQAFACSMMPPEKNISKTSMQNHVHAIIPKIDTSFNSDINLNLQNTNYSPQIFEAINHNMHQGMNIKYQNQVDKDFLNGMIPHHRGAVEMAKVILTYSKDEKVINLAKKIIAAQEQEIEMMKNWLSAKP